MDKVVYLLGAGFSAPLGLPVVSNFRIKSYELFARDPTKFSHFQEVFDRINDLSRIKNFYDANLYNIEEILSLLEMEHHLEGKKLPENFIRYIVEVIDHYTPKIEPHERGQIPGNWQDWLFGPNSLWDWYGTFVGSLLDLNFSRSGGQFHGNYSDIVVGTNYNPHARYSVITLNYDMVLENVCEFVNNQYLPQEWRASFIDGLSTEDKYPTRKGRYAPSLAKLHGSSHTGKIVPPTWNKGNNPEIVPTWKLAYQLLTDADHLRIIGYSLPTADSYVRYLLKSAVISINISKGST